MVPDVLPSFAPIEEALAKSFLPAAFGGKAPTGDLTSLLVRFDGLGMNCVHLHLLLLQWLTNFSYPMSDLMIELATSNQFNSVVTSLPDPSGP